jgi:hypothetical protein
MAHMQSNPALDFSVRESEFFQQLLARIGSARPRKLEIGAAVMMHSLPPPHSSKLDGHHGIIQSYDSDHDAWMIGNVSGLAENAPQLGFRYCSSHLPLSPPERVRERAGVPRSHSHARITHLFCERSTVHEAS